MKELQLIDRVVVEIRGEEGSSEKLSLVAIANRLRMVAEQIENGMKGNEWLEENPQSHEYKEVLFEHECTEFGFRMGDKSLIGMHYYGSEKKPKKYIIIVHVYDEENSQAYPLGGLFGSQISAYNYLMTHVDEVKNNHWAKGRTNKEDNYDEGATPTGWTAKDLYSGQSLEVEIHEMEEML